MPAPIRFRPRLALLAAASVGLAACTSTPQTETTAPTATTTATATSDAVVHLAAASGSLVSGTLHMAASGDGVHVSGEIGGLNPYSTHGFHVHETGDCSAADASSAGGHFNPTDAPHGRVGHGSHHLGDSDNIVADGDGVVHVDKQLGGVSLGSGMGNDIAGRAVVVHAKPDDYQSQPSGNAGARVACGVITLQE